ncbi:hypothetical protein RRG08_048241 [Elysia crispata]|uniref:Uncharacterized protein n=1 Tax=Elysia crispata TaxID=231223 RepID=A0AAE0Z6X8_9GAST|nr:hypothetical protein RRG08_048241 [Elysia crispata]
MGQVLRDPLGGLRPTVGPSIVLGDALLTFRAGSPTPLQRLKETPKQVDAQRGQVEAQRDKLKPKGAKLKPKGYKLKPKGDKLMPKGGKRDKGKLLGKSRVLFIHPKATGFIQQKPRECGFRPLTSGGGSPLKKIRGQYFQPLRVAITSFTEALLDEQRQFSQPSLYQKATPKVQKSLLSSTTVCHKAEITLVKQDGEKTVVPAYVNFVHRSTSDKLGRKSAGNPAGPFPGPRVFLNLRITNVTGERPRLSRSGVISAIFGKKKWLETTLLGVLQNKFIWPQVSHQYFVALTKYEDETVDREGWSLLYYGAFAFIFCLVPLDFVQNVEDIFLTMVGCLQVGGVGILALPHPEAGFGPQASAESVSRLDAYGAIAAGCIEVVSVQFVKQGDLDLPAGSPVSGATLITLVKREDI